MPKEIFQGRHQMSVAPLFSRTQIKSKEFSIISSINKKGLLRNSKHSWAKKLSGLITSWCALTHSQTSAR